MSRLVYILSLLLVTVPVFATDWPQWRGPNRDGISKETNWLTQWPVSGPKQLWQANVGTGCSAVAVSHGRLFAIGNTNDTDTVACCDAATGQVFWQYSYACPLEPRMFEGGPAATPTVDGERVYTLSRLGHLFCLETATGKVVWAKHLQNDLAGKMPDWGYTGSPLVLGSAVICDVGATGAATVAFDKLTGNILWKSGNDAAGYGSLVPFTFNGRYCLAGFNAFGLVVREAATGKELARAAWKTSYDGNIATPIVAGDKIFVSSGYNKGGGVFQFTGTALTEIWKSTTMRNHFNSCVLWQDHLYGFDESTLTCVTFATGTTKWKQDGFGKGALMLAGDKLIVQSETGNLVVAMAAPAGFKELARAKVLTGRCWVVPVLANGRLYVRNNTGNLVCLDVSNPK